MGHAIAEAELRVCPRRPVVHLPQHCAGKTTASTPQQVRVARATGLRGSRAWTAYAQGHRFILPSMEDSTARTIRLRDGRRLGYAEGDDPGGRPLFFFHGWPGSRVEGRLGDEAARATGVRMIALDRPGMGLSDYQPRRTLVDWPDDVIEVAAALGLDRFAVLGISGGGPYAAACAWKLSDRLTGAGLVSCLAPLDVPGVTAGMSRRNRLSFQLVGRLAVLRRVFFAAMAVSVRWRPDRVLERGVGAAVDKKYLDRPDVREILVESLSEAFRSGSRGPAWEMGLYARPWGFRLQDIRTPVHLWHGEQDANAPVTMARHLATAIPECRASFYPGEGHLHFVDRLPEILAAVRP
jgi:pimeloyl-ACP methyl ester carboxylesterase